MTAQSQILGFTSANIAEVEAANKALRTVLKPDDYGSLGYYKDGGISGVMAAALGNAAPIFSFRYPGANLCLVRRVAFSAAVNTTGFTAGAAAWDMKIARSFSASDTGGTDITPPASMQKLKTSMANSGVTGTGMMRISTTAALGAGTRTLDTNPVGVLVGGAAAAGTQIIPAGTSIFDTKAGEYPLVLANNEGFIIETALAMPATGTWSFGVWVEWLELSTYF